MSEESKAMTEREVLRLLCKAVYRLNEWMRIGPPDLEGVLVEEDEATLRAIASAPAEDKPSEARPKGCNCGGFAENPPRPCPVHSPKPASAAGWKCVKCGATFATLTTGQMHDCKPQPAVTEEALRLAIDRALADALAPNAKGFIYYGDAARIAAKEALRVLEGK